MKLSFTFVTVLLGLAAAAPQSEPNPSELALSADFEQRMKDTLEEIKTQKQDVGSTIADLAQQVGWQATGNLPGKIGKGFTILSFLVSLPGLNKVPTEEEAKDVLKNFASTAISFVPEVGALGALPGFISIIKTITLGIFNAQFPKLVADAERKEKCFSADATYEDLCNNCKPHLTISWLGKLNGCTKEKAVNRDGPKDGGRAKSFCATVLCSGYNGDGTDLILKQGYRYDPLRSFWCKSKDEQIGLLLNGFIGGALLENLHLLDANDLRNALKPGCLAMLKNEKDVCPSEKVFQEAEEEYPPVTFCAPGRVHKSRQSGN